MNIDETKEILTEAVHGGRVIGLRESLQVLNQFLDRKIKLGYPEYIARSELSGFMETYIESVENENLK